MSHPKSPTPPRTPINECICKRKCTTDIAITQQVRNFMRDGVRHMSRTMTFQVNQTTQDKCNEVGLPVPTPETKKKEKCLNDMKQGKRAIQYLPEGERWVSQITGNSEKLKLIGSGPNCTSIPDCRVTEAEVGTIGCAGESDLAKCTAIQKLGVTYRLRGTTQWDKMACFTQTSDQSTPEEWGPCDEAGFSPADNGLVSTIFDDESLWDSESDGDFLQSARGSYRVREALCKKLEEVGKKCIRTVAPTGLSLVGSTMPPYPDQELCCDCNDFF